MRVIPSTRVLWLWLALALLAFAAPFSPPARALVMAGTAVFCAAAVADLLLSRGHLSELQILPAQDRLRGVQGRPLSLAWEIRQQPVRPRRLSLAFAAATAEAEAALACPAAILPLRVAAQPLSAWHTELLPHRRGVYRGLRLAVETGSRWGLWQLRERRYVPLEIRIHPDLRAGRKAVLASPLYRLVAGAQRRPLVGQGREFERLREYTPGDGYSDVSWKATARRAFPVTRVYQWEQMQEVILCLDHSRLSALPVVAVSPEAAGSGLATAVAAVARPGTAAQPASAAAPAAGLAASTVLDLYVETALAAAATCHELGDRFGLVTFSEGVTECLPAAHGGAHLSRCRELLAELRSTPATADYPTLAAYLKAVLRRRAWVLILTSMGELGRDEELLRALEPVRGVHVVTVLGLLPPDTAPLPFAAPQPQAAALPLAQRAGLKADAPRYGMPGTLAPAGAVTSLDEIYRRLAGHREYRRLAELRRQFAYRGIGLRLEPAAGFLRAAVEAYLDSKRRQAL